MWRGACDGQSRLTGSFYCKRSAGQRAATLLKAALNRESWTEEIEEAFERYRLKVTAPVFDSVVVTGNAVCSADLPADGLSVLFTHQSTRLVRILKYLNTYSDNWMSTAIGSGIGGASGVEDVLVARYGLSRSTVSLVTTSGLGLKGAANGMRPVDMTNLLRSLVSRLSAHDYTPSDIMAVAGHGQGTLADRCFPASIAGSIVAKTGTLRRGVSALAGYMYTKSRGIVVFAIMNEGGNPYLFRRSQDLLVREMFGVCGGPALAPLSDPVGDDDLADVVIERPRATPAA